MKSIREGEADPRGPGLVFTHRDPRKRKTVAGLLKSLLRLSLQQPSLIPVALTPLVDCYQPDTDHAARFGERIALNDGLLPLWNHFFRWHGLAKRHANGSCWLMPLFLSIHVLPPSVLL